METNELHTSILSQLSDIKTSLAINTTETTNIKVRLTEMQNDIKDTKNAVQFQNGRVTKIESWSIEAQKIIEATSKLASDTSQSYSNDQAKVWTAFKIISILFPTIIILATAVAIYKAQEIAKEVVQQALFSKDDVIDVQKQND